MAGSTRSVSRGSGSAIVSPRFLGFNVAVFVAFGVGYLLLFLMTTLFSPAPAYGTTSGTSATNGLMLGGFGSLVMSFLLAPFVALVGGLFTGVGTSRAGAAAVTAFLGGAIGFFVMIMLLVSFLALLGGGGLGGLGEFLPTLFGIAIATGGTGAISGAISNHYQ